MAGDESNTAIIVRVPVGQFPKLSRENIQIPSPESNQVLVKISHVAQNPTDGVYFLPCNSDSYQILGKLGIDC